MKMHMWKKFFHMYNVYKAHQDRSDGYTIRQLCQEMHDFYKEHDTNRVQERLFLREYFPERAMTAYEAMP